MSIKYSKLIFFSFILIGVISLISFNAYNFQKQLAGTAIFPEKEYQEWLQEQENPDLTEEEKIKSTINTYYKLQYESWLNDTLFDFIFLFDKENSEAFKEYAYERGLLYVALNRFRLYNNQIQYYDYDPKFREIHINGQEATVIMDPITRLTLKKSPERIEAGQFGVTKCVLMKKNNGWLIRHIWVRDEAHQRFSHDMDFNTWVETSEERDKAKLKEMDAKVEAHRDNPFVQQRIKEKQEYLDSKKEIEKERLKLYEKISGEYIFNIEGREVIFEFYIKDNFLVGKQREDTTGNILQIVQNDPLSYEFRYNSGKIIKVTFIKNNEGNIDTCVIKEGKVQYEGNRLINQ